MSGAFSAPKGVPEYWPPRSGAFLAVRDGLARPAVLAGYGYIELPMFEETALFAHGVGESTDVVAKEMYTFADRGGRSVTLRPEGTAGVLRAVLEHRLDQGQLPVKLWYAGAFFRYERPQAGRYRQLQQLGIEAIGTDDPAVDAEVIAVGLAGYRGLGLREVRLELNSLGDAVCRPAYRSLLQDYLRRLEVDPETRRRVELNPLRVLDDKRPEVLRQLTDAPLMRDHLCDGCRAHYAAVHEFLSDLGVTWTENPQLVRGLDYYTRTTFEFVHDGLGAQSSVGGGGRYDGLSETLGGPPLPGIGFGLGVDRTLLAAESEKLVLPIPARCQVFVVAIGAAARRRAVPMLEQLRAVGLSADMAYGDRGLKGAMRAADRSGATLAVLLGDRELADGMAQLRDLATGDQIAVPLDKLVDESRERLSGATP
jgi:histidyl-tRNA synthetase